MKKMYMYIHHSSK